MRHITCPSCKSVIDIPLWNLEFCKCHKSSVLTDMNGFRQLQIPVKDNDAIYALVHEEDLRVKIQIYSKPKPRVFKLNKINKWSDLYYFNNIKKIINEIQSVSKKLLLLS